MSAPTLSLGNLEILVRVFRLGRKMHPALSLGAMKHHVLILRDAVTNMACLRNWYGTNDNPLLSKALARYPLVEGAMYWPYINHTWPVEKRLQVIDRHYRMLDGAASIIARATFEDTVVLDCEEEYPGLRLVLEKAPWFLREGEIVLSIFVGIDRVYSVAFTLGEERGKRMAYIGALQGRSLENAMEIYRNLTHALHGMRPRDFLLSMLKMLCASIGVGEIWGVRSDCRQHNGKYFSGSHKEKLLADYDEVWTEHDGVDMGNGFFALPAVVSYKDMGEIPSRKRASYRRRYAMLDKLALQIGIACNS